MQRYEYIDFSTLECHPHQISIEIQTDFKVSCHLRKDYWRATAFPFIRFDKNKNQSWVPCVDICRPPSPSYKLFLLVSAINMAFSERSNDSRILGEPGTDLPKGLWVWNTSQWSRGPGNKHSSDFRMNDFGCVWYQLTGGFVGMKHLLGKWGVREFSRSHRSPRHKDTHLSFVRPTVLVTHLPRIVSPTNSETKVAKSAGSLLFF